MYQTLTNVNDLILTLIMADLRNARFLKCFEDADIAVENFDTRLERSIFKLVGFEDTQITDELYGLYLNKQQSLMETPVHTFFKDLQKMALEFLAYLIEIKAAKANKQITQR